MVPLHDFVRVLTAVLSMEGKPTPQSTRHARLQQLVGRLVDLDQSPPTLVPIADLPSVSVVIVSAPTPTATWTTSKPTDRSPAQIIPVTGLTSGSVTLVTAPTPSATWTGTTSSDSTPSAVPETTSWQNAPLTRSTFSLLTVCVSTLALCIWTALHINLPKPTRSSSIQPKATWKSFFGSLLRRKGKWVLVGIFAPEILVYMAWMQWLLARRLTREMSDRFSELDLDFRWNMTHSFFALMGGFACLPADAEDATPMVLTAAGIERQFSEFPESLAVSESTIRDRSKADYLAKTLVCIQASYTLVEVIGRVAASIPVSLLEVNTTGHIFCALFMYYFWFAKPLDVREPILLRPKWTKSLAQYVWLDMPERNAITCTLEWGNSASDQMTNHTKVVKRDKLPKQERRTSLGAVGQQIDLTKSIPPPVIQDTTLLDALGDKAINPQRRMPPGLQRPYSVDSSNDQHGATGDQEGKDQLGLMPMLHHLTSAEVTGDSVVGPDNLNVHDDAMVITGRLEEQGEQDLFLHFLQAMHRRSFVERRDDPLGRNSKQAHRLRGVAKVMQGSMTREHVPGPSDDLVVLIRAKQKAPARDVDDNQQSEIDLIFKMAPVLQHCILAAASKIYLSSTEAGYIPMPDAKLKGLSKDHAAELEALQYVSQTELRGVFPGISRRMSVVRLAAICLTPARIAAWETIISDTGHLERLNIALPKGLLDKAPIFHQEQLLTREASNWPSMDGLADYQQRVPLTAIVLATGLYGGLHLLAWHSYFPTPTERLLWDISGITIAATGGVIAGVALITVILKTIIQTVEELLPLMFYPIARIVRSIERSISAAKSALLGLLRPVINVSSSTMLKLRSINIVYSHPRDELSNSERGPDTATKSAAANVEHVTTDVPPDDAVCDQMDEPIQSLNDASSRTGTISSASSHLPCVSEEARQAFWRGRSRSAHIATSALKSTTSAGNGSITTSLQARISEQVMLSNLASLPQTSGEEGSSAQQMHSQTSDRPAQPVQDGTQSHSQVEPEERHIAPSSDQVLSHLSHTAGKLDNVLVSTPRLPVLSDQHPPADALPDGSPACSFRQASSTSMSSYRGESYDGERNRNWIVRDPRARHVFLGPPLVFYVFARLFLVVEAFISLRQEPLEIYATPRWAAWWPRFGGS